MGAHGPVYHFMFLYDLYAFFTLFYMILSGFMHDFIYVGHILKTHFTHMLITFLDVFKDHFARPSAHNFALLCKNDFPTFFNT